MAQGVLSILVTFVFNVVATITSAIISPFIQGILLLFPDLSARFIDFINFLGYAITYLTCILQWFLFTPTMWIALFNYFFIKYSIFVVTCSIKLALNIYNKLKP